MREAGAIREAGERLGRRKRGQDGEARGGGERRGRRRRGGGKEEVPADSQSPTSRRAAVRCSFWLSELPACGAASRSAARQGGA
eukprot:671420-Rhodomonas_salina.1